MIERLLHSVEAEQSVLGGLLLNNDTADGIGDVVTADDFSNEAHRILFRHITHLIAGGKPADVVTLADSLSGAQKLDDAGGLAYLGELVRNVPTAANIRHYAQIVRDRRIERDLVNTAGQITELAHDTAPLSERLDRAQQAVLALTETAVVREAVPIGTLLPLVIERVEARRNGEEQFSGLPTGLKDLDRILGGLHEGQLIVVAGRPGAGKSIMGLQIAARQALDGLPAAFFSLEMDADELAERALVNAAKLDADRVRRGKLDESEAWDRVNLGLSRLHDAPLFIDDSAGATVEQIRAKARRLKRKHGIRLFVVDYLQLMTGRGDNRTEEVSSIMRGLKLLAKELRVPIVALSQLSRKCEDRTNRRPMLSDLRESGSVEQDGDVVLLLYRDELYDQDSPDKGVVEINVAKQRMGRRGVVYATWLGEHYAIADRADLYVPRLPTVARRKPSFVEADR